MDDDMPMPPPLPRNENTQMNVYDNEVPTQNVVQMGEPNCQSVLDELQLYKNYFAENGLAPLAMPRMGGKYSYRSKSRRSRKSRRRRRR